MQNGDAFLTGAPDSPYKESKLSVTGDLKNDNFLINLAGSK